MCDFCDNIPTKDEHKLMCHEFEPEEGIPFEYGVQAYRQDGKAYLSLYDAYNGETAYMKLRHCPTCGRALNQGECPTAPKP